MEKELNPLKSRPSFLKFQKPTTFHGRKIELADFPSVTDRQERIPGYDQRKLNNAKIFQSGAGGLGSEVGEGLVRKGVGKLSIADPDWVEITNLNRQHFFLEDLGKNKAIRLAKNLKDHCTYATELKAYPYTIEKLIETGKVPEFDIALFLVDSYSTRFRGSKYLLEQEKPGVFVGVSEDTDTGYVFIQEPGGPCFSCVFPRTDSSDRIPCPNVPAVKDILKVVAGLALFSIDSLLMGRDRNWNLRMILMSGFVDDIKVFHKKRPGCELCHGTGQIQ
jgi:molybdopterin/thiamine biosynthesis adenylyltransferase